MTEAFSFFLQRNCRIYNSFLWSSLSPPCFVCQLLFLILIQFLSISISWSISQEISVYESSCTEIIPPKIIHSSLQKLLLPCSPYPILFFSPRIIHLSIPLHPSKYLYLSWHLLDSRFRSGLSCLIIPRTQHMLRKGLNG